MTRVAAGRMRSTSLGLGLDAAAASARVAPPPHHAVELDARVAGHEPHLVAGVGQPAVDEPDRLDDDRRGAVDLGRLHRAEDPRHGPVDPVIASRSRRAVGILEHDRGQARRGRARPPRSATSSPKRSTMSSSAGSPGSTISRATWSASITTTPGRSASQPRHRRLAAADRPGDPDRGPSRRALLELEPGILGRGERGVDVGQLARDPAQLDEVGGHGRIAERELEMALAQAEPGQLGIERQLLLAIGVLRELLRLPAAVASRTRATRGRRPDRPVPFDAPSATAGGRRRSPAARAPAAVQPLRLRLERRTRPSSRRRPPSARLGSRRRRAPRAPSSTTHSFSQTVSSSRRSWDTTRSVAGDPP